MGFRWWRKFVVIINRGQYCMNSSKVLRITLVSVATRGLLVKNKTGFLINYLKHWFCSSQHTAYHQSKQKAPLNLRNKVLNPIAKIGYIFCFKYRHGRVAKLDSADT